MDKNLNTYLVSIFDEVLESFGNVDSREIKKLIFEIANSKGKIICSGLGKNVPLCEKFVGTLLSIGIDSAFLNISNALHGDLGMIKEIDLLILISKSSKQKEIDQFVEIVNKKNCDFWLLTMNSHQIISKKSICLKKCKEGDPFNIIPINSTLIFLILLNYITVELITLINLDLDIFRNNHPAGEIGSILSK